MGDLGSWITTSADTSDRVLTRDMLNLAPSPRRDLARFLMSAEAFAWWVEAERWMTERSRMTRAWRPITLFPRLERAERAVRRFQFRVRYTVSATKEAWTDAR